MKTLKTQEILGISFFNGDLYEVFEVLNSSGGLMTVPSGPGLVNIYSDKDYFEALKNSEIVLPDSGFMVLLNNLFKTKTIRKISGLAFINAFIMKGDVIEGNLFLVNPTDEDDIENTKYLLHNGFSAPNLVSYTAPFYNGKIEDERLLWLIEECKPSWILINIGGGVQEILGLYLKRNLSYKPAIVCTGAAIAFKTGRQINIPEFIDKLYLGWLFRCISKPRVYIPRYLKGLKLISMFINNKF